MKKIELLEISMRSIEKTVKFIMSMDKNDMMWDFLASLEIDELLEIRNAMTDVFELYKYQGRLEELPEEFFYFIAYIDTQQGETQIVKFKESLTKFISSGEKHLQTVKADLAKADLIDSIEIKYDVQDEIVDTIHTLKKWIRYLESLRIHAS